MTIISDLRMFVRRLFRSSNYPSAPKTPDSLARTIKESTHVRGGDLGLSRAGTEAHHDIVAKGHKNYEASFDGKRT